MRRLPFSIAFALLATTLSVSPATAGTSDTDTPDISAASLKDLSANLDDAIHSAQSLRADGKYAEAIQSLGQLMLVAPDDPRVVSEYGKVLVQQGRGEEASEFLHRAIELDPTDWSSFSALGVAYDEIGKPKDAKKAFEHALTLKPGEAVVLNNMAISRMLSGDLPGAHAMIEQAHAADGADAKIASNVALVESRMPATTDVVASAPVPVAHPQDSSAVAVSVPARQPVVTAALSPPHALGKDVVMEHVPADPLAGPVLKAKPAKHHAVARVSPVPKKPTTDVARKSKTPSLRMSADAS